VVHAYPHDAGAFTEGLFYHDGYLYESTGLEGHSTLRKVDLATGQVLKSLSLAPEYFGEGIVDWHGRLLQLTWVNHVGFIYDLATFAPVGRFGYAGEGWALTENGRNIIMSDGTPQLRFLDPVTLKPVRLLTVTADGAPVKNLNELEWVKGEILANIWLTNRIARIDPASGKVTGWIDLTGLMPPEEEVDLITRQYRKIKHPLVAKAEEMNFLRALTDRVAKQVIKEKGVTIDYSVGAMIELPRAAVCAGELSRSAEFFSFGTNDLTQTTFGISRDDSGRFLGAYIDKLIFEKDPFVSLDQAGVGELVRIAVERGRKARPDIKLGICGEHGGDPASIGFFERVGLDYISCSPYRVPIARLAAAQAALQGGATREG